MRHDFDHIRLGDKIVYEDNYDHYTGTVVDFKSNDEVLIDFYDDGDGYHIGKVSYTIYALNDNYRFSLISKCESVNLEEFI